MNEKKKNELDMLRDLKKLIESCEPDAIKVLKNNDSAAIRLRRSLQDIRETAKSIRNLIQERRRQNAEKPKQKRRKKYPTQGSN